MNSNLSLFALRLAMACSSDSSVKSEDAEFSSGIPSLFSNILVSFLRNGEKLAVAKRGAPDNKPIAILGDLVLEIDERNIRILTR